MYRDPKAIWLREVVGRAGFATPEAFSAEFELKPYRIEQLYRAAMRELLGGVEDVTTLPLDLRARLQERGIRFSTVEPVVVQRSNDGQTTKALLGLRDGKQVEAVLMEHREGRTTVCISSQAGCAFACAFCSTGQAGFSRHLTATEIADQARFFARELREREKKITNIVFMGMGEPFHNYDAVMEAVALLHDPNGMGIGHRHITISTVGWVDRIDDFTNEHLQVNLAISLHAPDDETRGSIMPVNRRHDIAELMAACERYVAATKRKVFFEYVMLAGTNDSDRHARALADLMRGHLYHVNLIPYNATPDAPFQGSSDERVWKFAKILEDAGVPSTVRHNMGTDISAACGQLRVETQPKAQRLAATPAF